MQPREASRSSIKEKNPKKPRSRANPELSGEIFLEEMSGQVHPSPSSAEEGEGRVRVESEGEAADATFAPSPSPLPHARRTGERDEFVPRFVLQKLPPCVFGMIRGVRRVRGRLFFLGFVGFLGFPMILSHNHQLGSRYLPPFLTMSRSRFSFPRIFRSHAPCTARFQSGATIFPMDGRRSPSLRSRR